jgi:ABC-type transport system substrate-binding protein
MLLLAACSGETSATGTTASPPETPTTSTTLPSDPAVDGPVFRVGLVGPVTTANWWAAQSATATPADQAVLAGTKESLFTLTRPGFALAPALAATSEPVPVTQEGSTWVAEQPLRDDVRWSDGVPVTAHDLAFYFQVVRELGLEGRHSSNFPEIVSDVVAVDDHTVRIQFSSPPSLVHWHAGVAMAPMVPAHFWEPHVEAARRAPDPAGYLMGIEAPQEPSVGSLVFDSWAGGEAPVVAKSNPDYFARGTETTVYSDGSVRMAGPGGEIVLGGQASGEVLSHHTVGPAISGVEWHPFPSADAAYDALAAGDVDYVLDTEGMSLSQYQRFAADPSTRISLSQADSFRYLAFNLRKPPMSDPVFRQAVATIIDKELLASSLYNGTMFPAYTLVHPGLTMFHDPGVTRFGWSDGQPMSTDHRYETAITMLTEAGYTWENAPELVHDEAGKLVDVVPGEGLEMPNGQDVPELTILAAPGPTNDPERVTVALWIGQWLADLGVEARTELTDLDSVAGMTVEPSSADDLLAWDLHVLGWGSPNHALPGLTLAALFHSRNGVENGGLNATGYASAEFDRAADAFVSATSMAQAAVATKEMDRIIATDVPYVTLYRPAVIEASRSSVHFPTPAIMGGHGAISRGWPEAVRLDD